MPLLTMTEYDLPNGRKRAHTVEVSEEAFKLADQIKTAGFHFECELLRTGEYSFTIGDDDTDYALKTVPPGPDVTRIVEALINEFYLADQFKEVSND